MIHFVFYLGSEVHVDEIHRDALVLLLGMIVVMNYIIEFVWRRSGYKNLPRSGKFKSLKVRDCKLLSRFVCRVCWNIEWDINCSYVFRVFFESGVEIPDSLTKVKLWAVIKCDFVNSLVCMYVCMSVFRHHFYQSLYIHNTKTSYTNCFVRHSFLFYWREITLKKAVK